MAIAAKAAPAPAPCPGRDEYQRRAETMKAVADPTRLQLLALIRGGGMNVGALADAVVMERTSVSNHLTSLRVRDLILPGRNGKETIYALTDAGRRLLEAAESV